MTAWTEDIYNFVSLFLEKDLVEGFKEDILGADSNIDPVVMQFNVTGTYSEIGGKFSKVLGNVAIVDCNYVHNQLFPALKESIKPLRFREPIKYTEYWIAIN